jgi:hypothetical protein
MSIEELTPAAGRALARFRFYEELNDFLPRERRKRDFDYRCARAATIKNAIEALGVPHTEVELILVDGQSVDFGYLVGDGDRISVYPKFERFDIRELLRVRDPMWRDSLPTHLGGLARSCACSASIPCTATRSRTGRSGNQPIEAGGADARSQLLKSRTITHGCFVHALRPQEQLREGRRLQLTASAKPFTLCLHCNLPSAPSSTRRRCGSSAAARGRSLSAIPWCEVRSIYWEGSHWQRMRQLRIGASAHRPIESTVTLTQSVWRSGI